MGNLGEGEAMRPVLGHGWGRFDSPLRTGDVERDL